MIIIIIAIVIIIILAFWFIRNRNRLDENYQKSYQKLKKQASLESDKDFQ